MTHDQFAQLLLKQDAVKLQIVSAAAMRRAIEKSNASKPNAPDNARATIAAAVVVAGRDGK
jgi:hypothetical protein